MVASSENDEVATLTSKLRAIREAFGGDAQPGPCAIRMTGVVAAGASARSGGSRRSGSTTRAAGASNCERFACFRAPAASLVADGDLVEAELGRWVVGIHRFEGVSDRSSDHKVAEPLPVGRNDIPGSVSG
jgi:hypothetical protein